MICLTVFSILRHVVSGSSASEISTGEERIENIAAKPALFRLSENSTDPPRATTGMPWRRPADNTPNGVFPLIVWLSMRPSPVIIRSAPSMRRSNPTASRTISIPGRSRAPSAAANAPPTPQAAPAPGITDTSTPVASANAFA